MGKEGHTVEFIVAQLREADVLMAKGQSMEEVVRQLGISDATYYKWRKEYGGLQIDQTRRYKELEQENQRLRKHGLSQNVGEINATESDRIVPCDTDHQHQKHLFPIRLPVLDT